MRAALRFFGGLGLLLGSTLYVEAGLPEISGLLYSVPYAGPWLLGPFAFLVPPLAVTLFWTVGYLPMFGGLVPRAKLEGKKVGTCGKCGHSWELGKDDAVRYWFRTKDMGPEDDLVPDTQFARICPKCSNRLDAWAPVTRKDDVKLPERLRTPPKYAKSG